MSKKQSLSQRSEVAGKKAQIVRELSEQTQQVEALSKALPDAAARSDARAGQVLELQTLTTGAARGPQGAREERWVLNAEAAPAAQTPTPAPAPPSGSTSPTM